jgi:hypothetical protein
MTEIQWERTVNGLPAILKESSGQYLIPVLALLTLTPVQMADVVLISADFSGNPLLFARRLGVYLEAGSSTEFLGIYVSERENDAQSISTLPEMQEGKLPSICLRHVRWDQKQDSQRFRLSANMKAYAASEEHIHTRIVFLPQSTSSLFISLLNEAERIVYHGIPLKSRTRVESMWDRIQIDLMDSQLACYLFYILHVAENPELEAWVAQYHASFMQAENISGILPDGRCFISYPHSVMERLSQFPEESFQEYFKRKQSNKKK